MTSATTPSGAEVVVAGDTVTKLHHPRTDAARLAERLAVVAHGDGAREVWVQPLRDAPGRAADGRLTSVWPRVGVLDPEDGEQPWAEAGRLLADLHGWPVPLAATDRPGTLPLRDHGWPARLARARARLGGPGGSTAVMLGGLGDRLLDEVADEGAGRTGREIRTVVHGDFHLGNLARTGAGLRLLDPDDLGLGDPAWDLARPAGYWAAGLLADEDWDRFLGAYADAGGRAVPPGEDPWPRLDLPARCAVFVAAVRAVAGPGGTARGGVVQPAHSALPVDALVAACSRM
ncbi:aminoglycoside phosphotransferase family protein [Terrabacter aeriphilus]|uniref:Aminoglycoside phosphotransferase family protein n=1 Tax=Terrabacter aeriphilus TaxID=515662 RepID=A0ABP9J3Z1_9MICO